MPSAIRHDHEFSSKGLVTILMERQGADEATLQAFLMKTFPDCDAFACVSGSVPTPEFSGIPHAALIGVDGKLLWDGSPLADTKQISELIDEELAKVKKGWGATAEAKKIRAMLYGKADLDGARKAIEALPEGEERTALQAELDRSYNARKKSVSYLQEHGRWLQAHDAAKDLLRSVESCDDWKTEATQLLASFDDEAAKAELAAAKKLERAEKQIRDKKRDQAPKSLQAVIKSASGTKTAARAEALLRALETKVE